MKAYLEEILAEARGLVKMPVSKEKMNLILAELEGSDTQLAAAVRKIVGVGLDQVSQNFFKRLHARIRECSECGNWHSDWERPCLSEDYEEYDDEEEYDNDEDN